MERMIERGESLDRLAGARSELEILLERLARLEKLEMLIKGRNNRKQESFLNQLKQIVDLKEEFNNLIGQVGKADRSRYELIEKQISELEDRENTLRDAIRQAEKDNRVLRQQVESVGAARKTLQQRTDDVMEIIELAEQAELNRQEIETICERALVIKRVVEEEEQALRQRSIDLLFKVPLLFSEKF